MVTTVRFGEARPLEKPGQLLNPRPMAQGLTMVIHRCLQEGDFQQMMSHMVMTADKLDAAISM
jgi:hypothetical protein